MPRPGFEQWFEGEPLDPARLLYTTDGRPRVAVFSIAHLGDAERMFFVSLLLNQVLGLDAQPRPGRPACARSSTWMKLPGYFPPVANPPSKAPLLTLLKQGRAFGLGVVLATQNPVDLDYKGLSNIGTWFLGRLQTERDKARVLDGLEGASAGSFDRAEVDRMLSALQKRVFLLHNVHEDQLVTFETRWTLSYLRGPLSREQIRSLMAGKARPAEAPKPSQAATASQAPAAAESASETASDRLPVLPPGIEQFFHSAQRRPVRRPRFCIHQSSWARFASDSPTRNLASIEVRDLVYAASIGDGPVALDWARAERLDVER